MVWESRKQEEADVQYVQSRLTAKESFKKSSRGNLFWEEYNNFFLSIKAG